MFYHSNTDIAITFYTLYQLIERKYSYLQENTGLNEKELLLAISEGSEAAFQKVFEIYRLQLFSYIFQFTHNSFDTEEIVQEIFIKVWENKDLLAEVDYPRQYIYTLARNHAYAYLRNASRNDQLVRQLWLHMQNESLQAEDVLDARITQNVIDEALSYLSEKKQQVFRLRQAGLKHEEISHQLQLSKSTVKNIMVEVMKFLQDYFSAHRLHTSLVLFLLWAE